MVIFTRRRGNGLDLFPYRHLFFSTSSPGLGPQACTRVGGLLDMASSEEVGFGRGEGTCMVAPTQDYLMTNVNATLLIGDI